MRTHPIVCTDERRALGDRERDLGLEMLRRSRRRERRRRRRQHPLGELRDEVTVDLLVDDDPLSGVARLSSVAQSGCDGRVEVVRTQHDERVRTAEFQHDLLQMATGDLSAFEPARSEPVSETPRSEG